MTTTLRKKLAGVVPQHDTPIGVVHPYWARKPQNVLETIIKALTKKGATVGDPFMGSGTTVFSALKSGRSVIGSDINSLSVFLVEGTLALNIEQNDFLEALNHFLDEIRKVILPWYSIKGSKADYVERERYDVMGDFAGGNFKLVLNEVIYKSHIHGRWTNRDVLKNPRKYDPNNLSSFEKKFQNNPVNFRKIKLMENSRIAVPRGSVLSHFFTRKNIAAINFILNYIDTSVEKKYRPAFKLLLSSSLPLLRLSDKKASSQWPYWRPKKLLTSRNPVMVIEARSKDLILANKWVNENLPKITTNSKSKDGSPFVLIKEIPIQKLVKNPELNGFFDLVLTDPPYSDQAPYLEYSALWSNILGLTKNNFNDEIVISDSPDRKYTRLEYTNNITQAFNSCCRMVKKGGYVCWFYQEYDLSVWKNINDIAQKNGMELIDIIPIKKQRRSMKTVTSPGATLDGDMLSVFKKSESKKNRKSRIASDERLRMYSEKSKSNLFDAYSQMIRDAMKYNFIGFLAEKYGNVRNVLRK